MTAQNLAGKTRRKALSARRRNERLEEEIRARFPQELRRKAKLVKAQAAAVVKAVLQVVEVAAAAGETSCTVELEPSGSPTLSRFQELRSSFVVDILKEKGFSVSTEMQDLRTFSRVRAPWGQFATVSW